MSLRAPRGRKVRGHALDCLANFEGFAEGACRMWGNPRDAAIVQSYHPDLREARKGIADRRATHAE
jgi:hypothetical protein